ncbi:MAG: hypothetical protein C0494_15935 [Sphingobium sp.]|nr:hypothetical protein [Sphingobium sp.]
MMHRNGERPPINFASLMGPVALKLYGEPNAKLSKPNELRWGSHGGRIVYLDSGSFFDAEAGERGGTLDLLRHAAGLDKAQAMRWLSDNGLIDESPAQGGGSSAVRLSTGQRVVATFNFVQDGAILYRKHRIEPGREGRSKEFFYDHPDGRGSWRAGRGGAKQVPYRMDQLAASNGPILMAEGEKQADKLASWGFVATSIKDWLPDFASSIAGRAVVILPDNDDDGRKQAARVKKLAEDAGCAVCVIELPGLPPKGDIMDWRGSADDLRDIVAKARSADTNEMRVPGAIQATPYVWRDPATIPPRPWVYGRWFLRGTVACVVAPGGSGKSTMLAGTALALSSGQELLGKKVWDGAKRVWLWNLEDDMDELSRSIQAAAIHYGIEPADVDDRLYVDSGMEGAGLCTAVEAEGQFKLLGPVYDALTHELQRRGIDVLIVDPFVSSHEVEENANSKIDKIAKAWGRVAKAANCVIVLVHHTSKAGSADVTAMSARGAVALVNAARSTLVLNRMTDEQAQELSISPEQRGRYVSVADDKHNRAPAEKADWYELIGVDLGNGVGHHPGDSIAVAAPWSLPDPFHDVTAQHLEQVKRVIDGGEWRENMQSSQWVGYAVAQVLGLDADNKSDRGRIKSILRQWIVNGALKVERRMDKNRQERPFVIVGRWGE